MNLRTLFSAVAISITSVSGASAATLVLDDSIRCGAGNASNGIVVGDVTGNVSGATECWGTLNGNDPGPSGDGFQIGTMVYDFVAKQNTPGALEGTDIGLIVTPPDGSASSGTWAFDAAKRNFGEFLIVLKQASRPGFAVWSFEGADAASTSGTWNVAWSPGLSHLSVYAKPSVIPIPAAGFLLLGGLGGLVGLRRRRKS